MSVRCVLVDVSVLLEFFYRMVSVLNWMSVCVSLIRNSISMEILLNNVVIYGGLQVLFEMLYVQFL